MLKKMFISCLALLFVLVFICTTISYATGVAVTDENLKEAFEKFVTSEANEKNYKISVSNNIINVTIDNDIYALKYDLTSKPTFSFEVPIQKGMSYDDYKKKTDNLISLHMLAYLVVANIQGVEMKDASSYFTTSYLGSALNGSFSTGNSYMIVDDSNLTEGVTIEKTDDPKTIYTSEFGDRVMEYVNSMYKEKISVSDSNALNSYTLNIEKTETTDTSCKLVSTSIINIDADFSKIMSYDDNLMNSAMNKNITKENADYKITLKVGQKCKIEASEKISGYEFYGYDCVEINKDCTEMIAKSVGTRNGYFYIGDTKKSIYITVEEKKENATLETITLKVDKASSVNLNDKVVKEEEVDNNATNKDGDSLSSKLPKTGINNSAVLLIIIASILILITGIKLKKNRDIK